MNRHTPVPSALRTIRLIEASTTLQQLAKAINGQRGNAAMASKEVSASVRNRDPRQSLDRSAGRSAATNVQVVDVESGRMSMTLGWFVLQGDKFSGTGSDEVGLEDECKTGLTMDQAVRLALRWARLVKR